MLLRRIRGVLTSALVWGAVGALGMSVMLSMMVLMNPHGGYFRELWRELVDLVPGFFVYLAAFGGLVAVTVSIAERNGSVEALTPRRIQLWGGVAGSVVGLGMAALIAFQSTPRWHMSLESLAIDVLGGAFIGSKGASMMLRMARRSGQTSGVGRGAIARMRLPVLALCPLASGLVLGDCLYKYRHGHAIGWGEPLIAAMLMTPFFYFGLWVIRRARRRPLSVA